MPAGMIGNALLPRAFPLGGAGWDRGKDGMGADSR
jgi:hypothetical protein